MRLLVIEDEARLSGILKAKLGVRERTGREVRAGVIEDDGLAVPLVIRRQKDETELTIKETTIAGPAIVICCNEEEAQEDAANPRRAGCAPLPARPSTRSAAPSTPPCRPSSGRCRPPPEPPEPVVPKTKNGLQAIDNLSCSKRNCGSWA